MWSRQNKALLEASYRIAFRIAQSKKPHTIGEELIKPCLIEATTLVLGKEKASKLEKISLSNDTVKKRISEMSQDILLQVVEEIRSSSIFSLQLDKSTDVSSCVHLLVYARYIFENNIKEQYLFSEPLPTTCKGEGVFRVVKVFLNLTHLIGNNLLGSVQMVSFYDWRQVWFQRISHQCCSSYIIYSLFDSSLCFSHENSSIWTLRRILLIINYHYKM